MGVGATNTLDRLATSIGGANGVTPVFKDCADVPNGGVLFALPALLSQGLLCHIDTYFKLTNGYYTLPIIFQLLAFMALARLKFIENLKHVIPGEWGKLLGLDRVPEVRTMRKKIGQLTENGQPKQWSAEICKDWMNHEPNETGVLYVDGHVRVYHGNQTKLPRHYIARDKLCARATCDYWVNAMGGNPFFYITKTVDPGMLQVLEHEIIPRLEKDIPNQPTTAELEANPRLHRFTIIVDRAGYSPVFMARMWEKRIAIQTYHKYPGEDWNTDEFKPYSAKMPSGEPLELKLAERGTYLGKMKLQDSNDKTPKLGIWAREIRRLRNNDKQGSMVSTNFSLDLVECFVWTISRWCQENFFGYMRKEYNLDRLIDYGLEEMSETTKLINPNYRSTDSEIRKTRSFLNRRKTEFSGITFDNEIDPEKIQEYEKKKGELLEEIKKLEEKLEIQKIERKKHPKHVLFKDLSEAHKFHQLKSSGKHLIDTIKMIAYRAETAMASIVREQMSPQSRGTARVLLREVYNSAADLKVDDTNKTLTIRLHHLGNKCSDETVRYLCEELNATETIYPGTDYRMIYELLS
jgi:hypothetical protein